VIARLAFVVIAATAVGAALGLVIKKNVIHGAMFLVVNMASIAALYYMLGAEFLALAQVIVYAGAIMVLFVFAIMFLIPGKEETAADPRRHQRALALPLGALLLIPLLAVLAVGRGAPPDGPEAAAGLVTGSALYRALLTDYLLPFELTSLLLLAAIVGVMLLAKRHPA
jgi:NADH-quinone oxidoreductase subunit J